MSEEHSVKLEDDVAEEATTTTTSTKPQKKSKAQELFASFNIKNPEEKLVRKFVCSLNLSVPHNGTMYITTHFVLFSSAFPSKETAKIGVKDIKDVEKKTTLKVFSNALRISTHSGKEFFFGGFIHRDEAFNVIQLQRKAVEEEDEFMREQEKKKNAEKGDAMLSQYKTLKKIDLVTDIVQDLEADLKPKESKCKCIII